MFEAFEHSSAQEKTDGPPLKAVGLAVGFLFFLPNATDLAPLSRPRILFLLESKYDVLTEARLCRIIKCWNQPAGRSLCFSLSLFVFFLFLFNKKAEGG